jgi:NAD(P)-dependent dehydrogenase (short-subunit alcohol dehydrogenase family)
MAYDQWINGKFCLVTGASSGIGLATAWQLARMGATVVMTARDFDRGKAAVDKVVAKSGSANVHLLMADFASLDQVRSLARDYTTHFPALHVLINNAAIIPPQRQVSEDGYEMQFAVNYLAPFLLTNLLLPLLNTSAPSKIINVASMVHSWGEIDFYDLQSERGYDPSGVYANTKLANILFTVELSKRLAGTQVTANSLHPGVISTNLNRRYMGGRGSGGAEDSELERGAATSVYLASSNEVTGVSGKYFSNSQERTPSQRSQDEETARRLWRVSEQLSSLSNQKKT